MSQLSVIIKLAQENFDSWKFQIEAGLIKSNHCDYVTDTTIKPEASNADEKNQIQKDKKECADVILVMNPNELYHVKHCTTTKDVCNNLKEV